MLKFAASAVAFIALAYAGVLALLYFNQEKLIFAGSKLPANYKFSFPAQRYEEIRVDVPGATLHALHFIQPAPRGLVFFLHGNGGDLSTWTTGIDFYARAGYDLFIFDYRGYGLSTGTIDSEAQLHADVRRMWDTIAPRYRERKLPIVLYGRSHGTRDSIVPFEESVALWKMVKAPVELLKIDGADHNDIHDFPAYVDALMKRLDQVAAR